MSRLLAYFSILWSLFAGAAGYYLFSQAPGFYGLLPSEITTFETIGIIFMITAFLLLWVATYILDPGDKRRKPSGKPRSAWGVFRRTPGTTEKEDS